MSSPLVDGEMMHQTDPHSSLNNNNVYTTHYVLPHDDDEDWLNGNFSDVDPDNTENTDIDHENLPELDEEDEGLLEATRLHQVGFYDKDGTPYGRVYTREGVENQMNYKEDTSSQFHFQLDDKNHGSGSIFESCEDEDADDEGDHYNPPHFSIMDAFHSFTMRKRIQEANERWEQMEVESGHLSRTTKVHFSQDIQFCLLEEPTDDEDTFLVDQAQRDVTLRQMTSSDCDRNSAQDTLQVQVHVPESYDANPVQATEYKPEFLESSNGIIGADSQDSNDNIMLEATLSSFHKSSDGGQRASFANVQEPLPKPFFGSDAPAKILGSDATPNPVLQSKLAKPNIPKTKSKPTMISKTSKKVDNESVRTKLVRIRYDLEKQEQQRKKTISKPTISPAQQQKQVHPNLEHQTLSSPRLSDNNATTKASQKSQARPVLHSSLSIIPNFPRAAETSPAMSPILQSVLNPKTLNALSKSWTNHPVNVHMLRELRTQIFRHHIPRAALQHVLNRRMLNLIFDPSPETSIPPDLTRETLSSRCKNKPTLARSSLSAESQQIMHGKRARSKATGTRSASIVVMMRTDSSTSKWASKPGTQRASQPHGQQESRKIPSSSQNFSVKGSVSQKSFPGQKEGDKQAGKKRKRRQSIVESGFQALSLNKDNLPFDASVCVPASRTQSAHTNTNKAKSSLQVNTRGPTSNISSNVRSQIPAVRRV